MKKVVGGWAAILLTLVPALFVRASDSEDNSAPILAFCGTYIREWGFCGNVPFQEYRLEKEFMTVGAFKSSVLQRTPYGMFTTYGRVRTIQQSAPLTRTFWFEDSDGSIRNVNADLNPPYPNMFVRRKGEASP